MSQNNKSNFYKQKKNQNYSLNTFNNQQKNKMNKGILKNNLQNNNVQLEHSTTIFMNQNQKLGKKKSEMKKIKEIQMASTIDEITVDYTDENGQQIIRQIDKKVLSKGAWTTIMFLYAEWDRRNSKWSAPKARIDRFQKKNGEYRSQSKVKFTSAKQAQQIIETLQGWLDSGEFLGEEDE